jgi:hypothetical protein
MSKFWQALLAAQTQSPLVKQFVHDSRFDVIKYSAGQWNFNRVGPGDPFRNADVVTVPDLTSDAYLDFRFSSGGQADEWVSVHMPQDSGAWFKIYFNNELVMLHEPGQVYSSYGTSVKQRYVTTPLINGYPYDYPSMILQPKSGVNHFQLVNVALPPGTGDKNIYFDGFGLNVRGGPLPV